MLMYAIRHLRSIFLRLYDFLKGDLLYFSASLSFYTIFSLLPMLLVVFSVMTIFPDFKEYLEDFKSLVIANLIPTHSDVFLNYIDDFLKNATKLGPMGQNNTFITTILIL